MMSGIGTSFAGLMGASILGFNGMNCGCHVSDCGCCGYRRR